MVFKVDMGLAYHICCILPDLIASKYFRPSEDRSFSCFPGCQLSRFLFLIIVSALILFLSFDLLYRGFLPNSLYDSGGNGASIFVFLLFYLLASANEFNSCHILPHQVDMKAKEPNGKNLKQRAWYQSYIAHYKQELKTQDLSIIHLILTVRILILILKYCLLETLI